MEQNNLELCPQEVEFLQSIFIDMLQDKRLKSNYETKRLEVLLDKLSKF